MENVILVVHLILSLCLIAIVLLQRSEGGGLGIGGGGATTGRPPATGMTKLTWLFGASFVVTSVTLTIFSAQNANTSSVVDLLPPTIEGSAPAPVLPDLGENLLPPSSADTPLTPPRAE